MKENENYIPNYTVVGYNLYGARLQDVLNELQRPVCVNIYASTAEDGDGYDEESRKGGLGKSLLINKIYNRNINLKDKYAIIDLSGGQYNTKASILKQIVDIIQNNYEHIYASFKDHDAYSQFRKYLPLDEEYENEEFDPSFVAEEFFREFSQRTNLKPVETLYFDGYDRHHIGDKNAPLRIWLNQDLFPWLVHKMGMSVVVAGRDQLESKYFINSSHSVIGIKVRSFGKNELKKYTSNYFAQLDASLFNLSRTSELLKGIKSEQWNSILKYTDGKPIFIDLFCAITARDCLNNRFSKLSFEDFWQHIFENPITSTPKDTFKHFLMDRLYLIDNDEKNDLHTLKIADALRILSVAKNGLSQQEFNCILNKVVNPNNTNALPDNDNFFETVFTQDKLSYVKNRKNNVRVLHDEMAELLREYYWELYDKDHKVKNEYLDYIKEYYEKNLIPTGTELRETSLEKYRRILEYIAYLFEYRDKEKEIKSLNLFLYEFAVYLDSAPDMCRRLLGRAIRYYNLKKHPSPHEKSLENTLTVKKNFDQLSKILTRETTYLLTERGQGWFDAVNKKIEEIEIGIRESEPYQYQLRGVESLRGEQYSWESGNYDALKYLVKSKEGFYLMGELYGMNWVEHLLGFYFQRDANFETARKHHEAAIADTIVNLKNQAEYLLKRGKDKITKEEKSQILLYAKTLSRAGSNLAVNLRYRGRLISALRKLTNFTNLAQLAGTREKNRVDINKMQFSAIVGLSLGTTKDFTLKIGDPVLSRRLILTELVEESKKGGREIRIHHLRREEFHSNNLSESGEKSSDFERLKTKLKELEKQFIPITRPLNIEENNAFKSTLNINNRWIDAEYRPKASRELADIYYQYGKIMLAYQLEGDESFSIAQTAFENCLDVAEKAGFEYLISESMVTLSRLFYLQWRDQEAEFWVKKAEKRSINLKEERGYAPYRDLLANHDLTRGDLLLDINASQAVVYYFKMLAHAIAHNESRYHLAIETFCDRIKYLLDIGSINRKKIEEIFEQLHEEEKTHLSKDFLSTFLKAYSVKKMREDALKEVRNPIIYGIRKKMAIMMQKGEFIQAGCINDCLLDPLKKMYDNIPEGGWSQMPQEEKENLPLRYFQKFYVNQWYNRRSKAEETLREIGEYIEKGSVISVENPITIIYSVANATLKYREANIWNFEKLLLEEMLELQSGKNKSDSDREREQKAEQEYKKVLRVLIDKEDTLSNQMKRILAATLFRLGELLLIKGDKDVLPWQKFLQGLDKKLQTSLKMERLLLENINVSDNASLYVLNIAYWYARYANDTHIMLDSLQSIAASHYYNGRTIQSEKFLTNVLNKLHAEKIRKLLTDDKRRPPKFPFISAKMDLIEGNIHFSQLFELVRPGESSEFVAKLREVHKPITVETRAILHRMIWAYLSALNVLANPGKPYESFHFENMLLEINRRIQLIRDHEIIQNLQTGLEGVWGLFENLEPLKDNLYSIKQELSLHEASLLAIEVLSNPSK